MNVSSLIVSIGVILPAVTGRRSIPESCVFYFYLFGNSDRNRSAARSAHVRTARMRKDHAGQGRVILEK